MLPLATRLRPTSLDTIVGQSHLIGPGKPLTTFLETGRIPSMIFWGPPGIGKTTLAHVIAKMLDIPAHFLSGVTSKKEDLLSLVEAVSQKKKEKSGLFCGEEPEQGRKNGQSPSGILIFLDEIHRRNKAQQDALLPSVENGTVILIGATTENPSFTINNALLSRCQVFIFEPLTPADIVASFAKNKQTLQEIYPDITYSEAILTLIGNLANGDLRHAYTIFENACLLQKKGELTKEIVLQAGEKTVYHDRDGEDHYNIISAIHKSLRDSDADAACYWVQRMLSGGEDPLYVARRLLRFASEDIGPADNNALLLANQVYDAIAKIGMPECDVFLFQLALYLAKAPKNNRAYVIAQETRKDVAQFGNLPVPIHLRNAPTKFMKDIGYGEGYKYAHDYDGAKVEQEHFPEKLKGRKYG